MNNNKKIICITYSTGTGGSFLQQFLTLAKTGSKKLTLLSKHGNAHSFTSADMPINPGSLTDDPDEDKINFILDTEPYLEAFEPYITIAHIKDVKKASENFYKVIRITYDLDDIDELAHTFIGKYTFDETGAGPDYSEKRFKARKLVFKLNHTYFATPADSINVLDITWKELYKGDAETLVDKLSKFTGIVVEYFNIPNLLKWRTATAEGIELTKMNLK